MVIYKIFSMNEKKKHVFSFSYYYSIESILPTPPSPTLSLIHRNSKRGFVHGIICICVGIFHSMKQLLFTATHKVYLNISGYRLTILIASIAASPPLSLSEFLCMIAFMESKHLSLGLCPVRVRCVGCVCFHSYSKSLAFGHSCVMKCLRRLNAVKFCTAQANINNFAIFGCNICTLGCAALVECTHTHILNYFT